MILTRNKIQTYWLSVNLSGWQYGAHKTGRACPLRYACRSFLHYWMKVYQKKILLLGVTENFIQSAATISLGYMLFSLLIFASIPHMKAKIRRYGLFIADLFGLERKGLEWQIRASFLLSLWFTPPSGLLGHCPCLSPPQPFPPFSLANSYLPSLHSYFPPFRLLIKLKKWSYITQIFPFEKQNKLIRPPLLKFTNLRMRTRTACSHFRRLVKNTTGNFSKFIRPNISALLTRGLEWTRWLYSILHKGKDT